MCNLKITVRTIHDWKNVSMILLSIKIYNISFFELFSKNCSLYTTDTEMYCTSLKNDKISIFTDTKKFMLGEILVVSIMVIYIVNFFVTYLMIWLYNRTLAIKSSLLSSYAIYCLLLSDSAILVFGVLWSLNLED